ncbi:tol-pal system protein YbgF [Novipirellula galeiformis]|uniref:Tol-pal system protein YbgF n=1 Tax=Novipirellula galeiformis TaxID=2528004 RepID=A0A5C6CVB2_9BACT|nr:tol-pal system protein YbgF [Novipirellula galeiformis]
MRPHRLNAALRFAILVSLLTTWSVRGVIVSAQTAPRGSLVEDRAAQKLVAAGDTRYEAEEVSKAVEIWQSVIERYPRSKVRFVAHMRLGDYFLERDRAYDRARVQFEPVADEANTDQTQRAEATLKMGICFYHARNYGKCFQLMRSVIESFPTSPEVNQAYYYIGLGHFQLAHYSRAIDALEKVGTTLSSDKTDGNKLEAGKRFFIKIEDADLAILGPETGVKVQCKSSGGDLEEAICYSVGRNVRLVLGSIASRLGTPIPGNGFLEVKGGDTVSVTYIDEHTAEKQLKVPVVMEVRVVGDGVVAITDGAFEETLSGVVLDKNVNLRVVDPDRDVSDEADSLMALVEIYRLKTDEELESEMTKRHATSDADNEDEIDRYKQVDRLEVTLIESELTEQQQGIARSDTPLDRSPQDESTQDESTASQLAATTNVPITNPVHAIHTGVFYGTVALVKTDTLDPNDQSLGALPSDQLRLTYLDQSNSDEGEKTLMAKARCLEGNIGGVRVTRAEISDHELRVQTQLKTASALTKIGNRYKEFGLKQKATEKYEAALDVCEEIMVDARRLGGRMLEETYVQFWHIYFEMERLELAATMCQKLQREFPNSGFVDDALLQLGEVAIKQENFRRAIGIYTRLVEMEQSQLRGEAQFGIAEVYQKMAEAAGERGGAELGDRAFQEYKKVFDHFPDSGRVGEAVAKMADYYYQREDFDRAIDTFETVLDNHPDAIFLDVILFNYGRCLYRMQRKAEARRRFDQLISEFPESPLASDAKQISMTLSQAGF